MWPCGALELNDLRTGQILQWAGSEKTSMWILLEEMEHANVVGNRNFKLWCLSTHGYGDLSGAKPGMTTTYEFNHTNISGYRIISAI